MIAELARHVERDYDWTGVPDEERPIWSDIASALEQFAHDYEHAGSNAKRRLLFSALVGSLNPKDYIEGWSRVFQTFARRLEPPHVASLRELRKQWEAQLRTRKKGDCALGSRVWHSEYPLYLDLAVLGLIQMTTPNANGGTEIRVCDIADRFLEFLWDYDSETDPG